MQCRAGSIGGVQCRAGSTGGVQCTRVGSPGGLQCRAGSTRVYSVVQVVEEVYNVFIAGST